jgi:cell division protein FtsB
MKWFFVVFAALVLLLQYRIWLSPSGVSEVLQLRGAVATQTTENERLIQRNRQLAAEVHDLKQGFGALEERARSELGLIAASETYYQVVPAAEQISPAATSVGKTALRTAAR